jgi:inorganic triphosphatase YgiF
MTRRLSASGTRGQAAAPANEIELKLRVPAARWREVMAHPLLGAGAGQRTQLLGATYYDTPDAALWRHRIALRVRREGRRWVQAIKGGGTQQSGLHSRQEYETVLRNDRPDLSTLPDGPLAGILRSAKVAAALVPLLSTRITRTVRMLQPAPGVSIEAAFDRGVIRSGRRRVAVCELELELKRGPVTALFDLAQQLVAALPLVLEHQSKAARGYALHGAGSGAPLKAASLHLDRSMDAGDVFRAIVSATLSQVQGNAHGVLDADDPEYLHQMRVGLRRLRSALDLFGVQLGDSATTLAAGLRELGSGLGAARDWDVLMTEILPQMPTPVAKALTAVCAPLRSAARRKAKNIIKTNTYNEPMLGLGRWLAMPRATAGMAWREPARAAAARILAVRYARVLRRGRRLSDRSPAELHRLRIAVKKLRYAVEFFNDLFQVKAMAVQRARLAKLQDILGIINDAAAVDPLLDAARQSAREWPEAAATALRTWHQERAAAHRDRLPRAWRRFRAAPRPWQLK